nr:hypothetical protein CFP56_62500 [Quercus suber]
MIYLVELVFICCNPTCNPNNTIARCMYRSHRVIIFRRRPFFSPGLTAYESPKERPQVRSSRTGPTKSKEASRAGSQSQFKDIELHAENKLQCLNTVRPLKRPDPSPLIDGVSLGIDTSTRTSLDLSR